MKKFIAVFDGLKFSESTKEYAVQVARQCNAHLVGVFLEDHNYTGYKIYDLVSSKGGLIGSARKKLDNKDAKMRATAITNFETACRAAGLEFTIHRDRQIAIQELLYESVYADLLIIDGHETFTHHPEKMPTSFIRNLLIHVQCPVLLVPRLFKPLERLTLLYDGQPSSVYAIKMFSYNLAAMLLNPVEVLTVSEPAKSLNIPDNKLMKEFMKRHFVACIYTVLRGVPEDEILKYLKQQKDPSLIVLGAYQRGMVSRWYRGSMADALMRDLKMPLFIAHSK